MNNDRLNIVGDNLDADPNEGDVRNRSKKQRKIILLRLVAGILTVAICPTVFGGQRLLAQSSNSLPANASELLIDNNELNAADFVLNHDVWGGYFDGEVFFININLRVPAENIMDVEFSLVDGFFASQFIGSAEEGERVSKMCVGAENRLVMYGTEFDVIGDKISLSRDSPDSNRLLFWAAHTDYDSIRNITIEIQTSARFYDGKNAELIISIDLSDIMLAMRTPVWAIPGLGDSLERTKELSDP